ncbi:MAG TPA: class I SAM-dependent methyltransferase [Phycisphaerae bacterium]|nr:class I SAM-dependent methyltransferase [Phycisphaerae bacterium]HRW52869.1 class I SAM-dependent methyltransferase [Phycisphaerae bacterium]
MCICETMTPETTTTGDFSERMAQMINNAGLALMTSVGHRTGLFDTMATIPPAASGVIAKAAGLNERYVREWLGAMVSGQIVTYDAETKTYALPPEHAALLTRNAAPNNFAAVTQFIAVLGGVEDRIVECFREGGGVSYSEFPRFHAVMAEESDQTVASSVVETILPLAGDIIERLQAGIDVLDVGCGRGHALLTMATAFPRSRFCGYDFCEEAIAHAQALATERGLANIRFAVRDVATLRDTEAFDFITAFDSIHDQAAPAKVLANIQRALRAGGTFLMQDISGSSHVEKNADNAMAPFMYTVSCMHCMSVSLAQGGEGLGAMWGREKAQEMLRDAGFVTVAIRNLAHDILNDYYVIHK